MAHKVKSKNELSIILEKEVPEIPEPSFKLEQYTTPGDLASLIAWDLQYRVNLVDARILDLGAGTCRLSTAVALLGASYVIVAEYDPKLLEICREALSRLGLIDRVQLVRAWIRKDLGLFKAIDVVISNPPFGIARRGADREFLEYSFNIGPRILYFILKSGNLEFHKRIAENHGYSTFLLARYRFPIKASMMKHRSRIRRVDVDVIVFVKETRE
ncbi:MAG: METTL5 family protein [Desulfurococcales archaeon]|nr:METTL5 family protein [Desulfurococcales archaeon]